MSAQSLTRPDHEADAIRHAEKNRRLTDKLRAHARSGRDCIADAIDLGHDLTAKAREVPREFDDWIAHKVSSIADYPSRTRCYDFMRLAKVFPTVETIPPEADSINRALLLAGAIARREPGEIVDRGEPPPFLLRFKLPDAQPSEWTPEVRKKFLTDAKPIVEAFQAALALESVA